MTDYTTVKQILATSESKQQAAAKIAWVLIRLGWARKAAFVEGWAIVKAAAKPVAAANPVANPAPKPAEPEAKHYTVRLDRPRTLKPDEKTRCEMLISKRWTKYGLRGFALFKPEWLAYYIDCQIAIRTPGALMPVPPN